MRGTQGGAAVYIVRTLASPKKPSANSNAAAVSVQPAPGAIDDLKADVTPAAVVLAWTPPKPFMDATPTIAGYRVYRAEAAATATPENPLLKSSLARIGEVPPGSQSFRDSQFNFGATYVYSVRSFAQYPAETLESADSNLEIITPRDTFPPAAPQELIAVLVPAQGNVPAHIELSWAISPETDLAGYNVYRTEQAGVPPTRLNTELLLTPAFRDMNVQPGHALLLYRNRRGQLWKRERFQRGCLRRRARRKTPDAMRDTALTENVSPEPDARGPILRTGIYTGALLIIVMWVALVVANRMASLEPYALERNAAAYGLFLLFMLIPIARFWNRPLPHVLLGHHCLGSVCCHI